MATLMLETVRQQYKEIVTDGFKQSGLSLYEVSDLEQYAKDYASVAHKLDEMLEDLQNHKVVEEDLVQWGLESLKEDRMYKKSEILESMENLANDGEPIFTSNDHYHNPHDFNAHIMGMEEFSEVNNYDVNLCVEVFMENREQIESLYK